MSKKRTLSSKGYTPSKEDEETLEELRRRYDYAHDQWEPILAEGRTDIDYIAGNTWDKNDEKTRKGRLTLKFDQLGQYLNQVTNAWRQNKRAIKVTPRGNGANDQTANVRANRIRQIEYESHAQEAYVAGVTGAMERSFGYVRVVAEFEGPRSMNKVLRIKPVPNPEQVLPDPDFTMMAGGDWKYLFYVYSMPREEFQETWPDAKTGSFSADLHTIAPDWHQQDRVLVAEYWTIKTKKKKLHLVGLSAADAKSYYEDELLDAQEAGEIPPGATILKSRTVDAPQVCKYLTNGVEILEGEDGKKEYEWPGQYIPFSACYGKMLYKSNEGITTRIILSFIRLARDAQKYYNWLKSTEGEAIKIPVRSSLWAYRGQLNAAEMLAAQESLDKPKVVLVAGAMTEATGNQVLPLPNREMPQINIGAYEAAGESARRDIQSALGKYSSSIGKSDGNVKSGVMQKALDEQSDQGSYHFTDAGNAMVEHVGEILNDLLPYFDDTAKDITVRDIHDKVSQQRVNDPLHPQSVSIDANQDHLVTISTGPAADDERDLAAGFLDSLLGNIGQIAPIIGPKASAQLFAEGIKLRNFGPEGDKMAEIVSPPDQGKGAPDPKQLMQQIQHAEQAMGQLNSELQKEKAGNQTKLQIADMDNRTKLAISAADRDERAKDRAAKIEMARISAAKQSADLAAEAMEERMALGTELAHDAALAAADAGHEEDMAQAQREHDAGMARLGHDQTMQQAAQAAALAPEPAPPAAGA